MKTVAGLLNGISSTWSPSRKKRQMIEEQAFFGAYEKALAENEKEE